MTAKDFITTAFTGSPINPAPGDARRSTTKGNTMPKTTSVLIDGENILYHYLQKDLFESDIWLFQMLCARLVVGLGIWLHPDIYQRMPTLLPFAVRDPSCRKRKEGDVEAWGAPSEHGYLRDDNTLVKAIPKSMVVSSSSQPLYDGKRVGNGFVAAHVWRQTKGSEIGALLASRDPWTNSFVPNLVWLPSDVAKLSDREGTFTQLYLQALSAKIYHNLEVYTEMRPFVDKIWNMLEVPTGIPKQGLPELEELSFFRANDAFIRTRRQSVADVVAAYKTVLSGEMLTSKVITTRYGDGLPSVPKEQVSKRFAELEAYLSAIPQVEQSAAADG
jgi:hypothetical protein